MPIYSYRCNNCKKEFEIFHNKTISEAKEDVVLCPNCSSENTHKDRILRGSVNLIFKGSGFYVNDYKNKSNNIPEP